MTIIRKSSTQRISKVVIHNETAYLSGQLPEDLNEGIEGQSKSVLSRVDHFLAEANTDKSKLLYAMIHVKHSKDAQAFNEVWNAWLPENCAPARTCVEANMVNDDVLVEVTVTAAL